MPSENQAPKRVVELVVGMGEQVRRAAYGDGARRGGRGTAPDVFNVANEGVAGATDIGRQIAGFAVRTAIEFGELLESLIGDESRAEGRTSPSTDDAATRQAVALALPSESPGMTTTASFDVRNDGYDTVDAMRLQCAGLFGEEGLTIPGGSIRFDPTVVEVGPRGTATVTCRVEVPRATRHGTYTGLITSPDRPGARMLVTLTVI